MDYVQMTLDDWVLMKEQLKKELNGVVCGFVRIGSILRKIEEGKLYEKDGYRSIAEFAKAEYKLEGYDVSRFIKINRRFTLEEDPDRLKPEFEQLGYSKLSDMLKLPDSDLAMITPETKREDIRELKRFNKSGPEQGGETDMRDVVEYFYKDSPETLNELYASEAYRQGNVTGMADLVNPSGTRTYRKGLFFLMMHEQGIKVKKFGGTPEEMSWEEFFRITEEIFGEDAEGSRTYEKHFGTIIEQEEPGQEIPEGDPQKAALQRDEKTEKTDFAPAQKKPENTESEATFREREKQEKTDEISKPEEAQQAAPEVLEEKEQIPGQMELTKDMPEYCPDSMNPPEKPENTECEPDSESEEGKQVETETLYGSRKQYIDTLTEYDAALYLAASLKSMRNMTFSKLIEAEHWEKWLKTEVDENGEEIDVVE